MILPLRADEGERAARLWSLLRPEERARIICHPPREPVAHGIECRRLISMRDVHPHEPGDGRIVRGKKALR
jgi:hypothetical protein